VTVRDPAPRENWLTPAQSRGLRILLAVLLIALVFALSNASLEHVIDTLGAANYVLVLAAAVPLILVDRFLMAYKWRMLLPILGVELTAWNAFQLYMASSFASLAVPVSLSSEALRTIMARRLDRAAIASSIIVERFLGIVAVLVLVLACAPITWLLYPALREELLLISVAMTLGAAGVVVAVLAWRPRARTANAGGPNAESSGVRLPSFAVRIVDAMQTYRSSDGLLARFVGLSVIETLMGVATVWMLGNAVGIEADFVAYLCIAPLVFVLIRLPIFYQGIGAIEAGYAYFFHHAVGTPMVDALSFGLLIDVVGLGVTLLGGTFFLATWFARG